MRAIGIIPARMESTRFPGKPLAPILGRPMLGWVWAAASGARRLSQTFVATPDEEIAAWCEANKVGYIMTAKACRNGTERTFDALRQIAQRDPDEIILNIQADEPTLRPESLDALVDVFWGRPEVRIASLYHSVGGREQARDPNRVKVIIMENGDAFSFSRKAPRPTMADGIHVGVYAFRRQVLTEIMGRPASRDLEQMAWLRAGLNIRMVKIDGPMAPVDRPEDIPAAEALLANLPQYVDKKQT